MYYFKRTCDLGPIQKAVGNKSETIYVRTPKQSSPQKGRAIFQTVSQYQTLPSTRKNTSLISLPLPTHIERDKESQLPTAATDEWGRKKKKLQQRSHYLAFNEREKQQHFSKGDTVLTHCPNLSSDMLALIRIMSAQYLLLL